MKKLYKTTMCRYYDLDSVCPMGENCHYAHGHTELRDPTDPINVHAQKKIKELKKNKNTEIDPKNPKTNFKTVVCKYYAEGKCKYGDSCSYAHGSVELRQISQEEIQAAENSNTE